MGGGGDGSSSEHKNTCSDVGCYRLPGPEEGDSVHAWQGRCSVTMAIVICGHVLLLSLAPPGQQANWLKCAAPSRTFLLDLLESILLQRAQAFHKLPPLAVALRQRVRMWGAPRLHSAPLAWAVYLPVSRAGVWSASGRRSRGTPAQAHERWHAPAARGPTHIARPALAHTRMLWRARSTAVAIHWG